MKTKQLNTGYRVQWNTDLLTAVPPAAQRLVFALHYLIHFGISGFSNYFSLGF